MYRVVLDANVLVSGLISPAGPPGKIIDAWLDGKFDLFTSPLILDELRRVFDYSRIRERVEIDLVNALLDDLDALACATPGILEIEPLTTDPNDTIYLICALEAQADVLVSGNLAHFVELKSRASKLHCLSPREFLALIQKANL